jgi:hypothetical protein
MRAAALSSCAATFDVVTGGAPTEEEGAPPTADAAELASHDLGPSTIRGAILGDPPETEWVVVAVEKGDIRWGLVGFAAA